MGVGIGVGVRGTCGHSLLGASVDTAPRTTGAAMEVIRLSSLALHPGYAKEEATQLTTLIRTALKCALRWRHLRVEILRRDGPPEAPRQHDSELVLRQGTAPAA